MEKYVVIGGQYQAYEYGVYYSLHAAKIAATKAIEYWDNWQGWHYPVIYRMEDTAPGTNFYGEQEHLPQPWSKPYMIRRYGDKWRYNECY